jgi:uncharacterized protein YhbP (UPF0306 family)
MYDKSHIVILEGIRTQIKKSRIKGDCSDEYKRDYERDHSIKLPYVNAYEIGQKVTVTYLNKSGEDCWCPDNFEVIDVEDMKVKKD